MSITKEKKSKLIKDFKINEKDTGSAYVQVAILSEKIKSLTEHLKEHHKDYISSCLLYTSPSPRDNR